MIMIVALVLLVSPASAHELGFGSVRLIVDEDSVEADLSVPTDVLGEAMGIELVGLTEPEILVFTEDIDVYLRDHMAMTGADGEPWPESVDDFAVVGGTGEVYLTAIATFRPPDSTDGGFTFDYDVVSHANEFHQIFIGVTDPDAELLGGGVLTAETTQLNFASDGTVETRTDRAFVDIVMLGFDHVVEGADHILFLIVLVLPAPLLIGKDRRWSETGTIRGALRHVLAVSTAFFVGHSVTLALSTFELVWAPARPVEVVIAVSIAVGAIHAIRPLIRRGEVVIAVAFGLVHGLAFAEILDGLALAGSPVVTLLAFNIGVELAQLAIVALVLPGVILLSRTSHYHWFRIGLAAVSLIAAAGWVAERVELFDNPLGGAEEFLIDHPLEVVVAFTTVAAALKVAQPLFDELDA